MANSKYCIITDVGGGIFREKEGIFFTYPRERQTDRGSGRDRQADRQMHRQIQRLRLRRNRKFFEQSDVKFKKLHLRWTPCSLCSVVKTLRQTDCIQANNSLSWPKQNVEMKS